MPGELGDEGVVGGVEGAGLGDGEAAGGVVDGDADGVFSPGFSPSRSDRDSEHAAANVVTSASRQNPESSFFIRSFLLGAVAPRWENSKRCARHPDVSRAWCTLSRGQLDVHGGHDR